MIKIRIRAIVGIMIFLGYFLIYVVRYNLSVHLVDMVQMSKREIERITLKSGRNDSIRKVFDSRKGTILDVMFWDEIKMAQLFSAYHIGYCVCFPIFHNIGDRIGPTWVVGIAGMVSGILNCLTPASAYHHFWSFYLVRVIKGFCAGAMLPSMVQVLRHWVPPFERNHFMWAYCGITTGTCSTFLICAAVHFYSRWPVGFYVCGTMQILWSIAWVFTVSDSPRKHPCISDEELEYLNNTICNVFTIKLTNTQAPWRLILKSVAFWALCVLNFGYAWIIISLCIHGPLYYTQVLKYTLYQASALTALPFLLRLILGTIIIQMFYYYKQNGKIKRIKYIRKYTIFVSHVLPGMMISILWLFPAIPGPTILTLAVALTAAGMDSTFDICYEITPMYVNSVNTVIKIIGNTSGIIVSLCVGENTVTVWKNIWCFHATILLLCGITFLFWGETDVQPWNSIKNRPRRKIFAATARPSAMSNITEVEEDDSTYHTIQSQNKRSFLSQIR
ncbi:PREDICTED: sialin-like isoform X3 [Papilio xuthus]|uniref:Sialin-like isoform X3 n=1 Tax=Papilio xuthus TaxID=66420 RepID=A0AAJ6ZV82_PAPXU|nr:PREDICTED: sialin-like isoform X3 [Papilio xuthus]